jgi:hypothetical protein
MRVFLSQKVCTARIFSSNDVICYSYILNTAWHRHYFYYIFSCFLTFITFLLERIIIVQLFIHLPELWYYIVHLDT